MLRYSIFLAVFVLFLSSCEEEFIPEVTTDVQPLVVEGYIEAGEQAAGPYVILTRSIPFFSTIGSDELGKLICA